MCTASAQDLEIEHEEFPSMLGAFCYLTLCIGPHKFSLSTNASIFYGDIPKGSENLLPCLKSDTGSNQSLEEGAKVAFETNVKEHKTMTVNDNDKTYLGAHQKVQRTLDRA